MRFIDIGRYKYKFDTFLEVTYVMQINKGRTSIEEEI